MDTKTSLRGLKYHRNDTKFKGERGMGVKKKRKMIKMNHTLRNGVFCTFLAAYFFEGVPFYKGSSLCG